MLNLYSLCNKKLDRYELKELITNVQKHRISKNNDYGMILHILKRDPSLACEYASRVIKGRWPEAEPYIMKDPFYVYWYARDMVRGRWPEAEPHIKTSDWHSYGYARDVIKGRFHEAEPYIMKNYEVAIDYATEIIKGRFHEAEPYLKEREYCWRIYCEKVRI